MAFFTKEIQHTHHSHMGDYTSTETVVRYGRIVGVAAFVIVLLVLALTSFTIVHAGHTGVVSTFGRVSTDVLQEGFHFKMPWQKVTKMDNRIVKLEVMTEAFSSDLQTVSVNLAVNYRVDPSKSYSIVKNVGTHFEDVLITPAVNEVMKSIIAKYTAEQSISNRNAVSAALLEGLNEKLGDSGIYISDINIIDFDFSEAYISAIEAKQVAEQDKLRAQIEQEQKTMEKEAEAERKIIDAEAAAEVAKIEAEAAEYAGKREAAANEAISKALTDELIEYYKIQQWDGKLPNVIGSDTLIGFGTVAD